MAQGFTQQQLDQRNLGVLLQRVVSDLNRPDLAAEVLSYVQDAIRFYQSWPFFFTEQDNSLTAQWAANTTYPQGSTIQATISGIQYAMVALNTGTSDGTAPIFPSTIFTTPQPNTGAVLFILPPPGTPGTVQESTGLMWANAGLWTSTLWTQLSTVFNINTYTMPFGYQSPQLVEITTANLRRGPHSGFNPVDYEALRGYDVIQPAPITAYPTMWAWYQQKLYLWPYPSGFFPITVSFRFGPPVPNAVTEGNFWTQQAEALIRASAASRISLALIHDEEASVHYAAIEKLELGKLRSQAIQQRTGGIPGSDW